MATLLSLPLELRSQIYLDALSPHLDEPFTQGQTLNDSPVTSSWNLSFPLALLVTNQQIYAEAKHIFYGENAWVMRASVQPTRNTLPPKAAIPYVRRALLKIYMDAKRPFLGMAIGQVIDSSCRMLCRMQALQTLRIECAKSEFIPLYPIERASHYSAISGYLEGHPEFRQRVEECLWGFLNCEQPLVSKLLQPLLTLPGTCSLQKGEMCFKRRDVMRARISERAFADCLDAVIALRVPPPQVLRSRQ